MTGWGVRAAKPGTAWSEWEGGGPHRVRGESVTTHAKPGNALLRHPVNRYNPPMPMMLPKTDDSFGEAGVSDRKAREAAEETAGFEGRLIRLEVMAALVLAGVVSLVAKSFLG